jgi:soluble lytic murein transglycosylase-like protein
MSLSIKLRKFILSGALNQAVCALIVLTQIGGHRPTTYSLLASRDALSPIKVPSATSRELEFGAHDKAEFISHLISRDIPKNQDALSIAKLIVSESAKHDVDPLLVTSIIRAESMFRHTARSNRGALGLMQIMPSTGAYLAKTIADDSISTSDLKDPEINIRLGVYYVARLLSRYQGDHNHALVAYNWGPSNLARAKSQNLNYPEESVTYANKVLKSYNEWSRELAQYKAARYAIALVNQLGAIGRA